MRNCATDVQPAGPGQRRISYGCFSYPPPAGPAYYTYAERFHIADSTSPYAQYYGNNILAAKPNEMTYYNAAELADTSDSSLNNGYYIHGSNAYPTVIAADELTVLDQLRSLSLTNPNARHVKRKLIIGNQVWELDSSDEEEDVDFMHRIDAQPKSQRLAEASASWPRVQQSECPAATDRWTPCGRWTCRTLNRNGNCRGRNRRKLHTVNVNNGRTGRGRSTIADQPCCSILPNCSSRRTV
ncbi:hypothetical protein T11_6126 [Trichinella zimbabwensis]|uniref:Uncharacterized protein n=1 Tax=Trichinella zimbabwensis TaxID=268475 RepID=A0A0V1HKM0_9BILA|nr:hypothetical protein T11_6126 [Trichinella zimbabwensis]